jgi:hypothetical protein
MHLYQYLLHRSQRLRWKTLIPGVTNAGGDSIDGIAPPDGIIDHRSTALDGFNSIAGEGDAGPVRHGEHITECQMLSRDFDIGGGHGAPSQDKTFVHAT